MLNGHRLEEHTYSGLGLPGRPARRLQRRPPCRLPRSLVCAHEVFIEVSILSRQVRFLHGSKFKCKLLQDVGMRLVLMSLSLQLDINDDTHTIVQSSNLQIPKLTEVLAATFQLANEGLPNPVR